MQDEIRDLNKSYLLLYREIEKMQEEKEVIKYDIYEMITKYFFAI